MQEDIADYMSTVECRREVTRVVPVLCASITSHLYLDAVVSALWIIINTIDTT